VKNAFNPNFCQVYDNLMADKKKQSYVGDVVPLFITVDPERDQVRTG
jgi:cytochrome oxidase Cu insertion factor (SCO1/SenC/PrrC family)